MMLPAALALGGCACCDVCCPCDDHACRSICYSAWPCFGYHSTCWQPWPAECVTCPPPFTPGSAKSETLPPAVDASQPVVPGVDPTPPTPPANSNPASPLPTPSAVPRTDQQSESSSR